MSNKLIMSTIQRNQDVSVDESIQDNNNKKKQNNKKQQQINMLQTHCSLNSSIQIGIHQQACKSRFQSFKRIKEGFLNQKNNKGVVVHKIVHNSINLQVPNIVQNLQDALTIFSQQSANQQEFSQISSQRDQFSSQEIKKVMQFHLFRTLKRNYAVKNSFSLTEIQKKNLRVCYTQPNEEILYSVVIKCQIVKETSNLAVINQVNLLFHYHFYQNLPNNQKELQLKNKRLLNLYQIQNMKNIKLEGGLNNISNKKKYIALYQPYTQTLTQYFLKSNILQFNKFCQIIQELILGLLEIIQQGQTIQIDPFNVVMINQVIKIKIQLDKTFVVKQQSKNKTMKSLGIYLNTHFKLLYNIQGDIIINKFSNFNIFKRLKIKKFIECLMKNQFMNLEQAYESSLRLDQNQMQFV